MYFLGVPCDVIGYVSICKGRLHYVLFCGSTNGHYVLIKFGCVYIALL